MQRKTLFTLCAATVLASTTALGIVMAKPSSLLASRAWVGETSTDWNTAANWSGNAVPAAGDIVTVDPTPTLNYKGDPVLSTGSDGLAGDLTIGSDFSVTVTGKTLTLDGSTQAFNGNLILSDSTAIVKFTGGTIAASGSSTTGIKGQDNGAKIQIKGGTTLTSTMLIQGHMVIETNGGSGAGKLDNRGLVYANGDGTLALGENLLLDDTGRAVRWKVGNVGGAILEFRNEHIDSSKLDGDFAVANCSKLKFEKTIETNGTFDTGAAAGFIDVDAANSVEFRYDCVGGCTVIDSDQTYGGC